MESKSRISGKFYILVGTLQITFIVLFGVFVQYDTRMGNIAIRNSTDWIEDHQDTDMVGYYPMFQYIHIMIFFGIGFLYTFIKKYGYTGITMCFLLATLSIETALLMQNVWDYDSGTINIDIKSLILADFAAASALIALGGVFGKINPLQMVVFSVLQTVAYCISEKWSTELLQVSDLGEAVSLHMFSAVFGLSVALVVDWKKKVAGNVNETTSYSSNISCLVGTIILWTIWPTFNCSVAAVAFQQRSALNTALALLSSCVCSFVLSSCINKNKKFEMMHIQNASLAGGVAIGSVADLITSPSGALVVGGAGGIICVLGLKYATKRISHKLKIYDPCGINSLHMLPGAFSGLTAAIMAMMASEEMHGIMLYSLYPAMAPKLNSEKFRDLHSRYPEILPGGDRSALVQAGFQLLYIAATIIISITTGIVTGLILKTTFFDPLDASDMYLDDVFFEMPDEEKVSCSHCKEISLTIRKQVADNSYPLGVPTLQTSDNEMNNST